MPNCKYTVDDIMGEIELKRAADNRTGKTVDMQRIDEIVREILTQKKEEEIKKENRVLTKSEEESFQREIDEQTQTITRQFAKLKNIPETSASKEKPDAEKAAETPAPFRILSSDETGDITEEQPSKEEPAPVKKTVLKPEEYVEFKKKRNQKMQNFVFSPRRSPLESAKQEASAPAVPPKEEKSVLKAPIPVKKPETPVKESESLKKATSAKVVPSVPELTKEDATSVSAADTAKKNAVSGSEQPTKTPDAVHAIYSLDHTQTSEITADLEPEQEALFKPGPEERSAHLNKPSEKAPKKEPHPTEKAKADGSQTSLPEETIVPFEKDIRLSLAEGTEEDPVSLDKLKEDLEGKFRSAKIGLVLLTIAAILSLPLAACGFESNTVRIFYTYSILPFYYAALNLIVTLLAIVASGSIIGNVVRSLRAKRLCKDSYFLASELFCFIQSLIFFLRPSALFAKGCFPLTPVLVWMLFMLFCSKKQTARRALDNTEYLSRPEHFTAMHVTNTKAAWNLAKGAVEEDPVLAKNVKASVFDHFTARSFAPDVSDSLMEKMLWVALITGAVFGGLAFYLTGSFDTSLSILCTILLLFGGFVGAQIVSLPLKGASGVLQHFDGMVPDYGTIDAFQDTNAILLEGQDLFPENSIILHGIKTFQGKRVDDAIIDAASAVCQTKSVLKPIFLTILNHNTKLLRPVDSIQYEDAMGLSAWVNEKRVLIGNRELMVNHSIAIPKKGYEDKYHQKGQEVIYLATGGELSAAFVVEFRADGVASDIVNMLVENDITAVIRTMDSCVTAERLADLFTLDPSWFYILPSSQQLEYNRQILPHTKAESLLGNDGSAIGYTVSISSAKKLWHCFRVGSGIYMAGGVCGLLVLAAMLILGKWLPFLGVGMLLYSFLFLLIYWIYERNMRL